MSLPFTGNTSTSATSEAVSLPMVSNSYSLVNKSGGAITVNVYKITGDGSFCVAPLNKALSAGEIYESERPVIILATQQMRVQVSGSVDYDFNISNLEP